MLQELEFCIPPWNIFSIDNGVFLPQGSVGICWLSESLGATIPERKSTHPFSITMKGKQTEDWKCSDKVEIPYTRGFQANFAIEPGVGITTASNHLRPPVSPHPRGITCGKRKFLLKKMCFFWVSGPYPGELRAYSRFCIFGYFWSSLETIW